MTEHDQSNVPPPSGPRTPRRLLAAPLRIIRVLWATTRRMPALLQAEAVRFVKAVRTSRRLLALLVVVILFGVSLLLFTSPVYDWLTPLALQRMARWKYVLTAVSAVITFFLFLLSFSSAESSRTALRILGGAYCCILVVTAFLEPPPRLSSHDLEALKVFNREYGGVRITPDLDAVARGVALTKEVDPWALAQSALAQNKLEEARDLFDKALIEMSKLERVIAETHLYKGIALSRLKRHTDALHEANTALAILPHFGDASALRCRSLRYLSRLDLARAACKDATNDDPASAVGWGETGAVLILMGQRLVLACQMEKAKPFLEDAIAALRVALKAEPRNPNYWNNLAVIYVSLKRPEDGLKAADAALRLKPDHADALLNRGTALKRLKRLNEAKAIYEHMISVSPKDPEAWNNLGDAMQIGGDFDNALVAFDTAIQLSPDYGDAWFDKGQVLNKLKRYQEALDALGVALRINPTDEDALVEQARAFDGLGLKPAARESINKAFGLCPSDPEVTALRGKLLKIAPPKAQKAHQ
ncbi:MAG TPA: tetratricopeptide repeat protein [Thermoanaerobaculia bacterium]|nr:tetratricopeptide repeat protein [Thermoanaerobaculia bacterium]